MLDVSTQAKIAEYPKYITLDTQKLHTMLASKFTIATVGLFSTYSAKRLHMTHWKLTWKKENESYINNCLVLDQTQLHLKPRTRSGRVPIQSTQHYKNRSLFGPALSFYFPHISIATTTVARNSLTLKVIYRAPSLAQLEWKHFHIWRNGLPSQSNRWIRPSEVNIMVPPPQTSSQGYTQSNTKQGLSPRYYA